MKKTKQKKKTKKSMIVLNVILAQTFSFIVKISDDWDLLVLGGLLASVEFISPPEGDV